MFATPKSYFQQQYVAVIDTALGAIESRFASDTWNFLSDVESALITVPVDTNVSDFYGSDVDAERLKLHVSMFHDMLLQKQSRVSSFGDVVDIMKADATVRNLFPELTKVT